MAHKRRRNRRHQPRRFPRFILGILLISGLILTGVIFFNPWVWRLDLKKELEASKVASTVYDRDGKAIVTLYAKSRVWIPSQQIPEKLKAAFVATEDNRFYLHKGIDLRGIARALYQDIKAGEKVQGGSTITQQLVKNIFFTQEKQFARKIMEMAYAIRIEQQYTKEQILEFYLNSIYLGHGTWGVEGASRVYFGKSVTEVSIAEAAMIAALAKSPEYYSPFRNYDRALKRRNLVLRLMRKNGYLSAAQYRTALREQLKTLAKPGAAFTGAYFVDYVLDFLKQETKLSENYLRTGGLKIYTTMNRKVQEAAEIAFDQLPEAQSDRWGVIQPQGALVALDPHNGELLGMVGGKRFSAAQPNRSFQIHRQPGSAIKPFLFAAALENGYTAESQLEDKPLSININGTVWSPQNYDNEYRGWITLRTALEESVNTIAVQLVQNTGVEKVFDLARFMGLQSLVREGAKNDLALAPLALGGLTRGVTLLELTSAYSAFANHGIRSWPFGISRVYNARGELIYQGKVRQRQVIRADTAQTLTSMMEGVILRGTGIRAKPVYYGAGKTGTSNRNTNGWFIGYNDWVLAGVWIGNDRSSEPLEVNGVPLGSGMAAAIWGKFLRDSGLNKARPE